jgi:hypothetical protein
MRWGKSKDPDAPDGTWFAKGAPLPSTERAVEAIDGGTAGGAAALVAIDPAFDADAFVAWSTTVYARAVAAWHAGDPEPLRPVMAAEVWDSYAQHLLFLSAIPVIRAIMASARGTAVLVGATADGAYQSALIELAAGTDPAVFAAWKMPDEHTTWTERWLFQRPAASRTYASGAVAVCPMCGAPAQPEETGRCRYCHADITTRTAGWLVTRTQTTLASKARMDDKLAKLRTEQAARVGIAPAPVAAAPLQPPRAGPPAQPPRAG